MKPEPRMTFAEFKAILDRLGFLPGADRMTELSWADYYRSLGCYFPHELAQAVSCYIDSPSTEFWPPPGKLIRLMSEHRNGLGSSWDCVRPKLLAEAEGRTLEIDTALLTEQESAGILRLIPGSLLIGAEGL